MMKIIKAIILSFQYLISVSALVIGLFTRKDIGQNLFAPFNNKDYGLDHNKYKARFHIRIWTVILILVYVRLFFVAQMLYDNKEAILKEEDFSIIIASVCHFFPMIEFPLNGGWVIHYSLEASFLYYLGFAVAILSLVHMLGYEIQYHRKVELNQLSLGTPVFWRSFIGENTMRLYLVLGLFDPLIIGIISFYFYNKDQEVLGLFFLVSSVSMFIQGQSRRMKYRAGSDILRHEKNAGKGTLSNEERDKEKKERKKSKEFNESFFSRVLKPRPKKTTGARIARDPIMFKESYQDILNQIKHFFSFHPSEKVDRRTEGEKRSETID